MLEALLLVACFAFFGWLVKELIASILESRRQDRQKNARKKEINESNT